MEGEPGGENTVNMSTHLEQYIAMFCSGGPRAACGATPTVRSSGVQVQSRTPLSRRRGLLENGALLELLYISIYLYHLDPNLPL